MDEFEERFVRKQEVERLTGLTYPAIWSMIKAGEFPKSKKLTPTKVGWLLSEVRRWMANRPDQTYIGSPVKPKRSRARQTAAPQKRVRLGER